jgi:hypothetical protein
VLGPNEALPYYIHTYIAVMEAVPLEENHDEEAHDEMQLYIKFNHTNWLDYTRFDIFRLFRFWSSGV